MTAENNNDDKSIDYNRIVTELLGLGSNASYERYEEGFWTETVTDSWLRFIQKLSLADKMTEEDRALYEAYSDVVKILHALVATYNDKKLNEEFDPHFIMGWNTSLTLAMTEVTKKIVDLQKRYI